MPVIVFASPKGGAGKTTSSVILAAELAISGAGVSIIDADPNKNFTYWSRLPNCPENITVIKEATTEENIFDQIDEASKRTPFVIIDLEGTASLLVSYAISQADLVLIPLQASQLDAIQAIKAVKLISNQQKAANRKIPYALFLVRTPAAIETRTLKSIQNELSSNNIPMLLTQLIDREAYRGIFSFGGTVEGLQNHNYTNLKSAIINARAFTSEVVELIKNKTLLREAV